MSALPDDQIFDPESPVFRAHEGGKLAVHATQPLRDSADLALLYTPRRTAGHGGQGGVVQALWWCRCRAGRDG